MNIKIAVFRDVTPWRLVGIYWNFGGSRFNIGTTAPKIVIVLLSVFVPQCFVEMTSVQCSHLCSSSILGIVFSDIRIFPIGWKAKFHTHTKQQIKLQSIYVK
jgi:hypothetical protein